MFLAIDAEGRQLLADARMKGREDICCPECGEPLIVRAGDIRRAHFAHFSGSECLYSLRVARNPDLMERHARAVVAVQAHLGPNARLIRHEHSMGIRRPDLTFHAGARRVAVEVQLTAIDLADIRERSRDIARLGYAVFWAFGEEMLEAIYRTLSDPEPSTDNRYRIRWVLADENGKDARKLFGWVITELQGDDVFTTRLSTEGPQSGDRDVWIAKLGDLRAKSRSMEYTATVASLLMEKRCPAIATGRPSRFPAKIDGIDVYWWEPADAAQTVKDWGALARNGPRLSPSKAIPAPYRWNRLYYQFPDGYAARPVPPWEQQWKRSVRQPRKEEP